LKAVVVCTVLARVAPRPVSSAPVVCWFCSSCSSSSSNSIFLGDQFWALL